jgi:hypothetical protein
MLILPALLVISFGLWILFFVLEYIFYENTIIDILLTFFSNCIGILLAMNLIFGAFILGIYLLIISFK